MDEHVEASDMDGNLPGAPAGKPRKLALLRAAGDFDHAALVEWLNDFSCWKSYAQDDSLERLGIKEGDLLISDPTAELEHGQLVVMADFELGWNSVGLVQRDGEGALWAVYSDQAIPLDADHEMLPSLLLGFAAMGDNPGGPATADDLLLARRLPEPDGTIWNIPSHYAVVEARQDEAMRRFGFG
jgi:hypothetical protein